MRWVEKVLRASAVAVVGGITASACGSRSNLHLAAGVGSGGQGTASSSSASSGTGGTGGTGGGASVVPATCGGVMAPSSVLTVDAADYGDAVQPSLVVVPTTPPTAAVAYIWQPKANGVRISARVASFAGWGAWPPPAPAIANVQNTETGNPLSYMTLLAQSDPTPSLPWLDLLFVPSGGPIDFLNKAQIVFSTGVDGSNTIIQGQGLGTAQFLSWGGGLEESGDEEPTLLGGVVVESQGSTSSQFELLAEPGPNNSGVVAHMGCSSTPLAADAVTGDSGWLLAAGLGGPIGWLVDQTGSPGACGAGPGTALTLAKIHGSSSDIDHWLTEAQVVLQAASPITRIRMVNGPGGGTWIVWSLDGQSALTGSLVFDALTLGDTFPVAAAQAALVPTSFAVEALGDSLVVAAVVPTGGDDQVQVGAVDASGASLWSTTVQTGGSVDGALSLRAAPDGSALLLAWSELPPGGATHRVRVARVDCTTCAWAGAACATASDCCGGICEQGTCGSPAMSKGTGCASDADCAGGAKCDLAFGACVGSDLCESDADCTWATDICDTTLSICFSGGDSCTSDADCPVGERCDLSKGGNCLPGTCGSTGGACESDHDCCSQACDSASGLCN